MSYQNRAAKIQKLLKSLEKKAFRWKKTPIETIRRKSRIFARAKI
jgi:hypothetical protein